MQKPRPTCRPLDQVSSCRFTHSALLQTCNRWETSAAVDFTATLMPVRHCCEFLSHEYFITWEVIPILFQHQLNCSFFFLVVITLLLMSLQAAIPLGFLLTLMARGGNAFIVEKNNNKTNTTPVPPTNPACYISDLVVTGARFCFIVLATGCSGLCFLI